MWTGGYVSAGTASDGNGSLTIRQPPDSWWISWLTVLIPLAGDHKLGGWRLETRWLADINQPPGQCEPATWREWNSQRAKVNPVVESKLAEDIYGIPVCQTRIWKPIRICKYGNDFYDIFPVFAKTGTVLWRHSRICKYRNAVIKIFPVFEIAKLVVFELENTFLP